MPDFKRFSFEGGGDFYKTKKEEKRAKKHPGEKGETPG